MAYLGFQKGGNVCWPLLLTEKGGQTKFFNFFTVNKFFFLPKGGQGVNTPLISNPHYTTVCPRHQISLLRHCSTVNLFDFFLQSEIVDSQCHTSSQDESVEFTNVDAGVHTKQEIIIIPNDDVSEFLFDDSVGDVCDKSEEPSYSESNGQYTCLICREWKNTLPGIRLHILVEHSEKITANETQTNELTVYADEAFDNSKTFEEADMVERRS